MKKLILLFLIPGISYGQEYVAEAPLAKVTKSDFYSITLPPDITASLESDLRNIRILDSQEVEVPFLTLTEPPDYSTFEWTPMKIEKNIRKGCCTVITLVNDRKEYIDNFLFKAKNAEIIKSGVLRGSDDGELWFAVLENFSLHFGNGSEEATRLFEIPLSNYKYYRLTLNDSSTSPLNVVSIERTREDIIHGGYTEIPGVAITSYDSTQNRETWGVIEFDTAQYVDRIEFDVFGPHLFKRRATLLNEKLIPVQSFDIISGQARALFVGLKAKKLFIRVNNDNNPPLKFTQVAAYQLRRSLLAYLETGRDYRIALGKELKTPYYDIGFFKDSIPPHPTELEVGKLKEKSVLKTSESTTYFTNRNVIWVAIILVGCILAGMTVRMLKDKSLKKEE